MNLFDKEAHGKRLQKGRQSSLEGDWLNLFSIILKWANFVFFFLSFSLPTKRRSFCWRRPFGSGALRSRCKSVQKPLVVLWRFLQGAFGFHHRGKDRKLTGQKMLYIGGWHFRIKATLQSFSTLKWSFQTLFYWLFFTSISTAPPAGLQCTVSLKGSRLSLLLPVFFHLIGSNHSDHTDNKSEVYYHMRVLGRRPKWCSPTPSQLEVLCQWQECRSSC